MLQYRLVVEVNAERRDVEKIALEQLHSWLRKKRLDADALEVGSESPLGPGATGSLAVSERLDGARSLRALINEQNTAGQWVTQLTVDVPGNQRTKPWIWLDLDGPDTVTARVPKLARQLLEVFDAATRDIPQGEAKPIYDRDDVRALVDAVCDPHRRTLLFIAGSHSELPFDKWLGHVRGLLGETVGLAGGYVLSPEATEVFNNAIGPTHAVQPGTVRTFRPGVEPDDAEDGRRHKVLGTERIVNDSVRRLAPMLGRRAREAALQTPLPAIAVKVDRVFEQITNDILLAKLDTVATHAVEADERLLPAKEQEHVLQSEVPAGVAPAIMRALDSVLGGDVTAERILELAELARNARDTRSAIGARLADYETQVAELGSDLREAQKRLSDTQLDVAVAEDEHAKAAAEIRRLQKLLIVSGQAEQVWGSGESVMEWRPRTYEELTDRLSEWVRVDYTGDFEKLLALDEYDETAGWAGKIWDILGVLDDYGRVMLDGTFSGTVHSYLTNTPSGCRTFSATRHASDESDDVHNNPQYRILRMLPVPATVSADCKVFMGAHFKIAQYGMISPRLHYYNDVRQSGKVYVGYIGRHLRTSRTN
jgi:hypothetical protein